MTPLLDRAIACARYADELNGATPEAPTGDSVAAVETMMHALAYIAINQPDPRSALRAIAKTLNEMADDMPPLLAKGRPLVVPS